MYIHQIFKKAITQINHFHTCHIEIIMLLSFILKKPIEYIIFSEKRKLTQSQIKKFFILIKKRQNFTPIAYLIKKKEFYKRIFYIKKNILIPRNETEILIETIITHYYKYYLNKKIQILELGTGSGIIAITLALEINNAIVTTTDKYKQIIKTAKKNIQKFHLHNKIKIFQSHWFNKIKSNTKFDFIVSNPPYIDIKEKNLMSPDTKKFEPKKSLYTKNNGLKSYQCILKHAKKYLKKNGTIFLEINSNKIFYIYNILIKYKYKLFNITHDLNHKIRVITIQY